MTAWANATEARRWHKRPARESDVASMEPPDVEEKDIDQ